MRGHVDERARDIANEIIRVVAVPDLESTDVRIGTVSGAHGSLRIQVVTKDDLEPLPWSEPLRIMRHCRYRLTGDLGPGHE